MVQASQKIQPILVDCDWGRKNTDISKKYGVRGYPTVIFTDPKGEVVARLQSRSAAGVAAQIEELGKKFRMKNPKAKLQPVALPFARDYAKALAQGREAEKPVLLIFGDISEEANATARAFLDPTLKQALEQFVIVQATIAKDSKLCKQYKAYRGSLVKVLDPTAENPAAKPLASIQGKRNAKALLRSLDQAHKKWAKSRNQDF